MKISSLLVIGLAVLAPAASAQAVTLHCKDNEALVRIGDLPIPANVAEKWKDAPAATGERCVLSNGEQVLVRYRERQAFAWGTMGGSPPWQISLWVNGRKLVSRDEFRPGNIGGMSFKLNRITYMPGALELCRYPGNTADDVTVSDCTTREVNLAVLSRDPLELKNAAQVGRISVASAVNEQFCRSFIRQNVGRELQPYGDVLRLGLAQDSVESLVFGVAGHDLPFDDRAKTLLKSDFHMTVKLARFDFFNKGRVQTVIEINGQSRDFFGTAYLVNDKDRSDAEAASLVEKTQSKWMLPDELATLGAKDGWYLAPGSFDPRMQHVVTRISGVTFVLAFPFYREDNAVASLYRPLPSEAIQRVCEFQLVEPNF